MTPEAQVPIPIDALIVAAIQRLLGAMGEHTPYMAQRAAAWFTGLAKSDHPEDYFKHPLAFPMLLLPWWLEQTLTSSPDLTFQADLVYSSISGYYFIRLIDNVMDGHGSTDTKLLPVLNALHIEFQRVYQQHFEYGHPFWPHFTRMAMQSSDIAMRDAAMNDIDLDAFTAVAGRKVCGGKIPLYAVCYRYQCPELLPPWEAFFDRLGCWHQMLNDVVGWIKDYQLGTPSYFLCEGQRRKQAEETLPGWVIREGFAWALADLDARLLELDRLARLLHSDDVVAYVGMRRRLTEQLHELPKTMKSIEPLLNSAPKE